MTSLAIIILTHNEEIHIGRALAAVAPLDPHVVIVDAGSTDRTLDIAAAHGATILKNPWTNYARQFQWALDHADIRADWVMRLDADEIVEPDLVEELRQNLPTLPPAISGVNLKRKHVFMGRWIRHGGRYPLVLLRIWRRGHARIEQRWMDEHMLLTRGAAVTLGGGFADVNLNDLGFFTDKHNRYATREAVDVINARRNLFARDKALTAANTSGAANLTRILKEGLYNRLPPGLGAGGYFFLRYVVQLGFLDGREGAIYHVLQGFWYRYLVGAKVLELERAIEGLDDESALGELARLTGLSFDT
jgi:glycosyltransferase involved in cell wall biosynthesis